MLETWRPRCYFWHLQSVKVCLARLFSVIPTTRVRRGHHLITKPLLCYVLSYIYLAGNTAESYAGSKVVEVSCHTIRSALVLDLRCLLRNNSFIFIATTCESKTGSKHVIICCPLLCFPCTTYRVLVTSTSGALLLLVAKTHHCSFFTAKISSDLGRLPCDNHVVFCNITFDN